MINTVIALPYQLARLPLVIVGDKLSERLPEASRPRVTLDWAIGSADKFAGTLLRNRDIAQRGADRLERSDKLATAARLEQEATSQREQAREAVATGERQADQKRTAAMDRAASALEEADVTEARAKQEAKAKAARTASARSAAADQLAASRIAKVEQGKRSVHSAAEANRQAALHEAKAKLDDARGTRESATEARTDAERLSALAAAKKEEPEQG